ncbi:hypothetical protein SAMN02745174_01283 [Cetobacterium ceti]|uniref:Uncharacterized protein n=1 Tax=Cetobacterium ceti TaxID=180163 RepID=A0A1T4MRJ5_9FUSO|nr:hypothetical protein [Cetobacterium ceti]SJZ69338.1 hypothetical protein SAMN02745174_01283 [Cetobacterium ceti]
MFKSILLIIVPFILNILFLGKILNLSDGIISNPVDIVTGIAFSLSFGMGVPAILGLIIGIFIVILPSYIVLYIYLKRKKNKK